MLCPKCGMQIKDDDIFCAYCGETITPGAPVQPAVPNNNAVQPPYTAANAPVPPQYNAPPPYPQQQPYTTPQPPPGGGKKGGLIAVIVALSVLLAAALVVVIILLAKKDGGDDSSTTSDSTNAVVTTEEDETEPVTTSRRTTSATEPETEPDTEEETTTTTAVTEPETTTTVTTTKQGSISDDAAAQAEASFYSTRDLPTVDEFNWCAGQFGLIKEAPGYAEPITNPLALTGGWKAMLVYEENPQTGYIDREIDNFEIFFEGNRVTVSIDWYLYLPAYSEITPIDPSDTLITQLRGAVNGTTIDATGTVNSTDGVETGTLTLHLDSFWRSDGKQYGVGTLYLPNGSPTYVALVRK